MYPPLDALSSLSRLMRKGASPGRTRDDHLDVAAQLLAARPESGRFVTSRIWSAWRR